MGSSVVPAVGTLKITGNTDRKRGERYPIYYCTGRYATGLCEARATARVAGRPLRGRTSAERLQDENGLLAQVAASDKVEAAARAVAEAEHELDLFVTNPKLLSLLGEQKFVEGVEARQQASTRRAAPPQSPITSCLTTGIGDGDLLHARPSLSVQEKRRLMHGLFDRVVVATASGRHVLSPNERRSSSAVRCSTSRPVQAAEH